MLSVLRRLPSRSGHWIWCPGAKSSGQNGVRLRLLAGLVVCAAVAVLAGGSATAQDPPRVVHQPPVDAPIADGFRPPPEPYGAGNRGIEYNTEPGIPVTASAAGEVVFVGAVAWSLHVTVRHADGVRTSYSYLAQVDVVLGQRVRQGDRLGTAGERLHFGARLGDAYFDPATLFGGSTVEVELLPFEAPPEASADEERAALLQLTYDGSGSWFDAALSGLGEATGVLMTGQAPLAGHYLVETNPNHRAARLTWDVTERLVDRSPCTDAPPPPRPASDDEPRAAVLVGGLGSSSASASIDELRTDELGYDDDAVVRFSYVGGRTPDTGAAFDTVTPQPYGSPDTQGDLRVAAERLSDLVEAVAAQRPDAPVDVYAHSMGGVVTRLALLELERRGFDLDRLGVVATMGSPHHGADLATAVTAANGTAEGNLGLLVAEQQLETGLDPASPAARQLSETSDVVAELDREGVPDGVDLVSVAASGDWVVTAPRTRVDGARNVTVSLVGRHAHGELVGHAETTAELARALAGMPTGCEGAAEVVSEEVLGHGLSYVEDLAGSAGVNMTR